MTDRDWFFSYIGLVVGMLVGGIIGWVYYEFLLPFVR